MVNPEKLSEEVMDKVRILNDLADAVQSVSIDAEKADFIAQLLLEETDRKPNTTDSGFIWEISHNRVRQLVEIADDYTFKVTDALKSLNEKIRKITDDIKNSVGGGNLEDGSTV